MRKLLVLLACIGLVLLLRNQTTSALDQPPLFLDQDGWAKARPSATAQTADSLSTPAEAQVKFVTGGKGKPSPVK
jgi:hypothetical protein